MKTRNSVLTVIFWLGLATVPSMAVTLDEDSQDTPSRFAVGFDVDSYSNNFGGGITLFSPHFFNDHMWIQFTGDIAWVQGVANGTTLTTWSPYGLFKLGLMAGRFLENTPIRIYGGGGIVLVTLANNVSNSSAVGGYGVAGVEFLVNRDRSKALFIELGGMGTGAQADKMVNAPLYANGFSVSWGYKFYL